MTPTVSGIPRLMAPCLVLLASGAAAAAILEHRPAWTVAGDQPYALLGCAVATAGDVNGDGHDDVIVGARFHDGTHAKEGRAALHIGGHGNGPRLLRDQGWRMIPPFTRRSPAS